MSLNWPIKRSRYEELLKVEAGGRAIVPGRAGVQAWLVAAGLIRCTQDGMLLELTDAGRDRVKETRLWLDTQPCPRCRRMKIAQVKKTVYNTRWEYREWYDTVPACGCHKPTGAEVFARGAARRARKARAAEIRKRRRSMSARIMFWIAGVAQAAASAVRSTAGTYVNKNGGN